MVSLVDASQMATSITSNADNLSALRPVFVAFRAATEGRIVWRNENSTGEKRSVAVIWEATDRLGRLVTMTDAAWNHIVDGHGASRVHPSDIQSAIEYADEVRRDRNFTRRAIHYRGSDAGSLRLRVVVNYRPHARLGWSGEVITAYLTGRKYENEVQLWP